MANKNGRMAIGIIMTIVVGALGAFSSAAHATGEDPGKACDKNNENATTPKKCPTRIGEGGEPDPLRPLQWGLLRIRAPEAWAVATGEAVVVAVLDTGADLGHPDLRGKLVLVPGADFTGEEVGTQQDYLSHGTRAAGIIAATTNNGIGVSGVAPNAKILPVRVTNKSLDPVDAFEAVARAAAAIRFSANQDVDVISMSFAFDVEQTAPEMTLLREAVEYAWERGAVLVAAAGNGVLGANMPNPECDSPANFGHVICVAASGPDDEPSSYSQFDGMRMDFVRAPSSKVLMVQKANFSVPGNCEQGIVTTGPMSIKRVDCEADLKDGYQRHSGTSAAAPMVSGIAALLASQGLTNEEIVDRIKCTADDQVGPLDTAGPDPLYGWGRINALRAVNNERNHWPSC